MFTNAAPQKGLEGIRQSEEKVNYTQEDTERNSPRTTNQKRGKPTLSPQQNNGK